jgi:hypothetical protein
MELLGESVPKYLLIKKFTKENPNFKEKIDLLSKNKISIFNINSLKELAELDIELIRKALTPEKVKLLKQNNINIPIYDLIGL